MTRLTADATAAEPGDPVILRLTGSLDSETSPVLQDAFNRCLPEEPGLIVLDLGAADVATDAVSALARLADQASAWPGARLVLGGAAPAVTAMLMAAGLTQRVPMYRSADEALMLVPAKAPMPDRVLMPLEPNITAASRARRLVDRCCAEWDLAALRDHARLVVTELVSNAVRHAHTPLEVALSRRTGAVDISVRDHSGALPRPGGPVAPTVEGGRGLLVVDLLCRAWGATPTPDGKVVWATLETAGVF
ncbi:hypothetical protein Val02_55910 [Virgisporangium aliadipatigenens]|uniref:STAS domain-containing protein n=1 Tax=Virgisporangium aliadipatigenens TaxID=741659 RepID=A0A8J3YRN9_9ACTN|nr:ATP-binding protein [Virgisporangium aliadipatigenens]GIJ48705.1 hypothetical protein Val02_55910 [Virgisporangium aliadipatigenens]